jgi:putative ATPase
MAKNIPLAELLRAQSLTEVVGQDHLVGVDGVVTKIVTSGKPLSILLWGPPGVGKTSIARLYAKAFSLRFINLSATSTKISDIKNIIEEQNKNPLFMSSVLLFMDEIHRFNKAQQDAFLPHVEDGTMILVGATTENPSFYLNGALLSRLRVLSLNSLDESALEKMLVAYEKKIKPLPLNAEARRFLLGACRGDGRSLYNMVEGLGDETECLDVEQLKKILPAHAVLHDRDGDQHYNLISALHKAVRSSDPDAALYWFARMLNGGDDPLFLARRLIRMASEDIGLADPSALSLAIAARDSYQMLGSPEGELALAQVVVYLALAPKSNALYVAFKSARDLADKTSHLPPPKAILNAPTKLMSEMGYGRDYIYDHDTDLGCSGANNFPEQMVPAKLYQPVERGFEREMKIRLAYFARLRNKVATAHL